jgi:DNA-binding response OmpR family regulator
VETRKLSESQDHLLQPALVLVVTVKDEIATSWIRAIEERGPLCVLAHSAQRVAQSRIELLAPLALVDPELPDAWGLVERLASTGSAVIAASQSPRLRALALRRGCQDAIPTDSTPHEVAESVMRHWSRRFALPDRRDEFRIGPLYLHCGLRQVLWHGVSVRLTRKQFNLLSFLAQNPGEPFDTRDLLAHVWLDPYKTDGAVWTTIRKLRRAVQDHGHIVNRPGYGYSFVPEEPATDIMSAEHPQAGARAS